MVESARVKKSGKGGRGVIGRRVTIEGYRNACTVIARNEKLGYKLRDDVTGNVLVRCYTEQRAMGRVQLRTPWFARKAFRFIRRTYP